MTLLTWRRSSLRVHMTGVTDTRTGETREVTREDLERLKERWKAAGIVAEEWPEMVEESGNANR